MELTDGDDERWPEDIAAIFTEKEKTPNLSSDDDIISTSGISDEYNPEKSELEESDESFKNITSLDNGNYSTKADVTAEETFMYPADVSIIASTSQSFRINKVKKNIFDLSEQECKKQKTHVTAEDSFMLSSSNGIFSTADNSDEYNPQNSEVGKSNMSLLRTYLL
uniref:Uncharacterized protein LOC114331289 n=1 Tax=Diabrotica virgifera virgifera TaxID=50390 RepID=A0A6P7FKE3_DIAVI